MVRDFFKTIGSFGIYLLAFFIPALILVFWAQSNLFGALNKNSTEKISFLLEGDWTAEKIGESLAEKGIIKNAASISFLLKYKLNAEERAALKIMPGEYELSPSMKPEQIFNKLLKGEVKLYDLEIPAGLTIDEIAGILAASGMVSQQDATAAIRDRDLLSSLGIPSYIPEGYFTEGAYSVTRPAKATELIASLLEQSDKRLTELMPEWRERAQLLGFQPYDVLKIASIIEKETQSPEERKVVASVIHNRLRIGLPLQSDAALIYGEPPLALQGVTDADRKKAGPYNTYTSTELPLTPICSPSVASIEAALAPADTDFLYMVPKGDGTFDFSTRLKDHIRKIKGYRLQVLTTE
jgi:UPF0755 protein